MYREAFVLFALILCCSGCSKNKHQTVSQAGKEMSRLMKEHRFDEAAHVGLQALTGGPSDDSLYYWVALSYAQQGALDSESREQSLKLVNEYSDRSININPRDQLNRFNVATVLEYAGDLSTESKCQFYGKALGLLADIAGGVSSGELEINGTPHSAAPLNKAVAEENSSISKKLKDARCE